MEKPGAEAEGGGVIGCCDLWIRVPWIRAPWIRFVPWIYPVDSPWISASIGFGADQNRGKADIDIG